MHPLSYLDDGTHTKSGSFQMRREDFNEKIGGPRTVRESKNILVGLDKETLSVRQKVLGMAKSCWDIFVSTIEAGSGVVFWLSGLQQDILAPKHSRAEQQVMVFGEAETNGVIMPA